VVAWDHENPRATGPRLNFAKEVRCCSVLVVNGLIRYVAAYEYQGQIRESLYYGRHKGEETVSEFDVDIVSKPLRPNEVNVRYDQGCEHKAPATNGFLRFGLYLAG
jgi:hypothetical protein